MCIFRGHRYIEPNYDLLSSALTSPVAQSVAKTVSMIRKYHYHKLQTTPCHREEQPHNNHETIQEDKQCKATSSLFPIKMIAKLEWTQSNAQQNIEQLQNPTTDVTIKNDSTSLIIDPGVMSSIPAQSYTFVGLIIKYFLRSFSSFC